MLKEHSAIRATARLRRARLALVFALVSGAALILAACGGGGGGGSGGSNLHLQSPKAATRNLIGDIPIVPILFDSSSAKETAEARAAVEQQRSYAHQAVGLSPQLSSQHRGNGVTVAVADGGIEVEHPDLEGSFYVDPPAVRSGQKALDPARDILAANLVVDRSVKDDKYNVLPRTDRGYKNLSHGTQVTGIIAARDNDIGVVGIAPEAKILPIRHVPEGSGPSRYFNDVDPGHPGDPILQQHEKDWASMLSVMRLDWGSQQRNLDDGFVPIPGYKIPFVMNNSWGNGWRPRVVEIDLPGNRKGYFLQPRVVGKGYQEFTGSQFYGSSRRAMELLDADDPLGTVIVFAAGNDGWNSETGEIPVFDRRLSGEGIHGYLDPYVINPIGYLEADAPQIARTGTPANLPPPMSAAFLGNKELEGWWLAVVATDKNNRIASFSNGCGEAARFCLAAPGVNILSTVSPRDGDYDNRYYETESGTSMAAPVVSGALAVLKSRFQNLTPRQAVDILLRHALVDVDRGVDRLHHRIGSAGEATAPHAVGAVVGGPQARGNTMVWTNLHDQQL